MENEYRRGYDLPITEKKWEFWLTLVIYPLFTLWLESQIRDMSLDGSVWLLRSFHLWLLLFVALEFINCFGELHLVSEGIAITLFGKTLRRFPREKIRFLGGVRYSRKSREYRWICVCDHSMVELAEEQERKTPKMFQNSRTRPGWAEDMAGKYLIRYVASMRRQLGLPRKDILLIEWSPERLRMIQDMYPGVPWTDLTDKKVLDAERKI
jgi:hypothetical protein